MATSQMAEIQDFLALWLLLASSCKSVNVKTGHPTVKACCLKYDNESGQFATKPL